MSGLGDSKVAFEMVERLDRSEVGGVYTEGRTGHLEDRVPFGVHRGALPPCGLLSLGFRLHPEGSWLWGPFYCAQRQERDGVQDRGPLTTDPASP